MLLRIPLCGFNWVKDSRLLKQAAVVAKAMPGQGSGLGFRRRVKLWPDREDCQEIRRDKISQLLFEIDRGKDRGQNGSQ
jgi:hypothetical protein